MDKKKIPENILQLILYTVALAMGIVTIVLAILGEPVDLILLSIGITCLGFAGLLSIEFKNFNIKKGD